MAQLPSSVITVIGGSGFVGRYVVRELARRGYRVRVAVRRPDLAGHLQPFGMVGQIMPVQANVRYPDSLAAACQGARGVVNLVGALYSAGPQSFDALHASGAEAAARAAREAGVQSFVQMSAIGADPQARADYARTKAEGERLAREQFPGASIVRPSIIFGPEDSFFNRFAAMARFSPALPLIGGGRTRFQPVSVGDVAEAIVRLLEEPHGERPYELGGPGIFTFKELMRFTLATIARKRLLVPIPFAIAKMQAAVLGLLPKPLLTMDQVEMLRHDNVVSEEAKREGRTLEGLGITPEGIAAVVPSYLYRYRKAGQFSQPTSRLV